MEITDNQMLENYIRKYLEEKINEVNNTFVKNYIVYTFPNDSAIKPVIYTTNTILRVYYELLFNLESRFSISAKRFMYEEMMNNVKNHRPLDIEHTLYRYLVASVYPYIIADVKTLGL